MTDLSSGYSQVLKATAGNTTVYYTRGLELISRREGDVASFYLYDGGLSVRALTDEAGAVTDTLVFDAFGNETEKTGTTANTYGFQGEEQDATGLYYLRARYMDPISGTFTSMDTYAGSLSDPMSLHKYLFANSNPVMYSDPSGHSSGELTDAMGTCSIITILANAMKSSIVMVSGFIKSSVILSSLFKFLTCVIAAVVISGILNFGHLNVSTTGDIVVRKALPDSITWEDVQSIIKAKAKSITVARKYKRDGEWHHIVARTARKARKSRLILRASGFTSSNPITDFANVDTVENLVYLTTAMHRRLHTTQYHEYVYSILNSAFNINADVQVNKIDVSIALNSIRQQLMSMQDIYPQINTGIG